MVSRDERALKVNHDLSGILTDVITWKTKNPACAGSDNVTANFRRWPNDSQAREPSSQAGPR